MAINTISNLNTCAHIPVLNCLDLDNLCQRVSNFICSIFTELGKLYETVGTYFIYATAVGVGLTIGHEIAKDIIGIISKLMR